MRPVNILETAGEARAMGGMAPEWGAALCRLAGAYPGPHREPQERHEVLAGDLQASGRVCQPRSCEPHEPH